MGEVLVRHPRLRVYIMHAGFPRLDDLLAMLYAHPMRSIAVIEEAPFLSKEQQRDILYYNAARFLRLTPEQIAAHHKR